jgi:hypothetical protein
MVQTAITEAITTLAEAEDRFHLRRTEAVEFFPEWQTALTYMMANPHPEKPGYGLVTNGDDILFVKLKRDGSALYDVSRVFALFTSGRELYGVLQVLKRIAGEIVGVGG